MYDKLSPRLVSSGKVTDGANSPLTLQQKLLARFPKGRVWAYGIPGGDGSAETDGNGAGLLSTGGTDGTDLSSWRTASVAAFSVAVEPGSSDSGFGATPGSGWPRGTPASSPAPPKAPGALRDPPATAGAATDTVAGPTGAGRRGALELCTEIRINGTAAAAARRLAARTDPPAGRSRPRLKMPKTTATRAAT